MHSAKRTGRGGYAFAAVALVAALVSIVPQSAAAQARPTATRQAAPVDGDRPIPNETRPLPEIVARVQSTPPYNTMDYIGVETFHLRQRIYVLRFIDGRQVVVVHVDARSGRIVGRGQ